MKVLVVGGNRFVGREVVNRLLLEGHEVAVLALDALPDDLAPHAALLVANRNVREQLEKALAGRTFDAVVDNIAYEARQVELLADVLAGRLARYVLTSSVDVYGLSHPRAPREAQAPMEPHDVEGTHGHERYQRGKRACELALAKTGLLWTVLRPSIVTGRHDNVTAAPGTRHLAPGEEGSRSLFLPARVLDGGPVLLREDDQGVFKLAWVQDVATAAARALVDPRMAGEAFAVTGDEVWTTERLLRALFAAAGRDPDVVAVSARELEAAGLADYDGPYGRGPYWSVAENLKLRALGWKPTPAEAWLPKLLEAAHGPGLRPQWDRRVSELALAHHVRRRRAPGDAARALPLDAPTPPATTLPGRLDPAATRAYAEARPGLHPGHFRPFGEARLSSLGVGTWMGDTSAATDAAYVDAIVHAVLGGLNVVDTAINYRAMRSERAVGTALRRLASLGVARGAVFVATKGGFVTHDAADSRGAAAYVREQYLDRGLVDAAAAHRGHCVDARFVRAQLAQSLANLRLSHVDLYSLHNPELARAHDDARTFERRLTETFAVLESAVASGQVGSYGLATWDGLRVPEGDAQHLSLEAMVRLAQAAAGGDDHHLRAIQLPFNALRPEALVRPTQRLGQRTVPALEAARELGLTVFTSATLLQGSLALAPRVAGLSPAAACAQASRSAAGVTCALIGLRRAAHADEALGVARLAPLDSAFARSLFGA